MEALTDVSELCDRVRRLEPPILVAVEGFAGAGKSCLAAALGKRSARRGDPYRRIRGGRR